MIDYYVHGPTNGLYQTSCMPCNETMVADYSSLQRMIVQHHNEKHPTEPATVHRPTGKM